MKLRFAINSLPPKLLRPVCYAILIACCLPFYLQLYSSDPLWFNYTDDMEVFRMSHVVWETGLPTYSVSLNEHVPHPAIGFFDEGQVGDHFVPTRALGTYYFLAPFHAFGAMGAYLAPPLLGLFFSIATFEFVHSKTRPLVALVATLPIGLSPTIIFFSNALFVNVASVALVIAAFAILAWKPESRFGWALAGFFIVVGSLVRYETAIVLFPYAAGLTMQSARTRNWTWLLCALPAVALGLLFLATYNEVYGGLGTLRYFGDANALRESGSGGGPDRSLTILVENLRNSPFAFMPALVTLASLGTLLVGKSPSTRSAGNMVITLGSVLGGSISLYLLSREGNFGEGQVALASSYNRYFMLFWLPILVCVRLLAEAIQNLRSLSVSALACGVALLLAITGVLQAGSANFGIDHTKELFATNYSYEEDAGHLPENAIIFGDRIGRYVIARPIFVPQYLPTDNRSELLVDSAEGLMDAGYDVYLAKPWVNEDLSGPLGSVLTADGRFHLEPTEGSYVRLSRD
jgi:hypothetical protein